jgi:hypothetical protein
MRALALKLEHRDPVMIDHRERLWGRGQEDSK